MGKIIKYVENENKYFLHVENGIDDNSYFKFCTQIDKSETNFEEIIINMFKPLKDIKNSERYFKMNIIIYDIDYSDNVTNYLCFKIEIVFHSKETEILYKLRN